MIELLIVVAIIVILMMAVFYYLSPGQLIKEGQDGNRVAGIGTLSKAVSLYYSDAINNPGTLFMGTSSIIYISIPDPTATTTAGTNCAGLGFASGTLTYHCAASSTYLRTDGTGWVPINFGSSTIGSPISSLPVDPVNNATSVEYFAYTTDGVGGYQITANPAATKDLSNTASFNQGTSLALMTSFPYPYVISYTTSTYAITAPTRIAFDSHTNTVWVTNNHNSINTVTVFNDSTYTTTTHGSGNAPVGVAFDPHTNTVWETDGGNTVTIFNDSTYTTTTRWDWSGAGGVTFDPHTNAVWAGGQLGSVSVYNDSTYTTSTLAAGSDPWDVTLDPHTNTVWATSYSSGKIVIFNESTYTSSTINTTLTGSHAAFDPHTNTVWVTDGGSSTVTVFNDSTYTTTTLAAGGSPGIIASDPQTNALWVLNSAYDNITVFTPNH